MAIDSIGGGNSRDPNEALRAKRMAEDRALELKRMETRQRDEIERLQRSRDEEIRTLGNDIEREIESKKFSTQEHLETTKSAAEARIKTFEAESNRLTEEAKRQFQAKAQQLQRSAGELSAQRDLIVKNHQRAMEEINEKHGTAQQAAIQRGMRESALAHINATKRIEEVGSLGEAEVERVQGEMADSKRRAYNEGRVAVERAKIEAEENRAHIEQGIEFDKRAGASQLARERENLDKLRLTEELKADERLSRMTMGNQRNLMRTHSEGQRKLSEAQTQYHRDIAEAEKEARKKILDVQLSSNQTLNSLQIEAESQEKLARRGYEAQKSMLSDARSKSLTDNVKANNELRERLDADFQARGKNLTEAKEKLWREQVERNESELRYQRDLGKKHINAQALQSAKTLATHDAKGADPFYQLHRVNAQVEEREADVVVRVNVPEHEQDNVRVTLQRGSITVSGSRRSETKAKLEDGRTSASNSYQSYSESFPVKGKVLMSSMERSWDGGVLMFRIPKG